jgi:Skp family chaperone for outer membrane proteins
MKNKILVLAVIGFMACTVLICAKSTGEKDNKYAKENIGKTVPDSQAVKESYSDDWQRFKSESEQKIQDNENSIAAFKAKMEKSGKANYNKEIAKLEKTNHRLQKKLGEFKNNGKSAWERFKKGFNKEMDKLGKAVKDLTSDND